MNDNDEKEQLPVHITLGASGFAKIKMVRKNGEPFPNSQKWDE